MRNTVYRHYTQNVLTHLLGNGLGFHPKLLAFSSNGNKRSSFLGQHEVMPALFSVDQRKAQLFLQGTKAVAQGGLGDVQLFCRKGNAFAVYDH